MISRLLLGPMTLSWRTMVLLAPVGILAGLATTAEADPATRLSWLGAACLAQVALTNVYALGSALGLGRWRAGVLAVVVLGAATRAASLVALTSAFGDVDPLTPDARMIGATATFTVWGIGLGAAVQAWFDHRAALRAMATNADEALAEAQQLSRLWQQRLDTTATSPESLAATARALHDDVDSRLRPLSHRLWFTMTDRAAREQFLRSMVSAPLPLGWIGALTLIIFVWNAGFVYGLPRTLGAAACGIPCLLAILFAGQWLALRAHRGAGVLVLGAVPIASVTSATVVATIMGMADIGVVVIVVAAQIGIIVGVQLIAVSARLRAASLVDLAGRTQALEAERAAVAAYLHSTVQARWTAAAHRLEAAAEAGDLGAARRALVSARALLVSDGPSTDEVIDCTELARAWDGIASVHLEVDPHLPAHVHGVVGRIVDEAISNAVRHGRARTIRVSITMAVSERGSGRAEVVVEDDGTGTGDSGEENRRGLGSDWLDTVAEWSLTRTESGSHLHATVAV